MYGEAVTDSVIRQVIRRLLLPGQNYREPVLDVINAWFLTIMIAFFKEVKDAKMTAGKDWYTKAFLNKDNRKGDIATAAGINIKTVHNTYGGTKKKIVIEAAEKNYQAFCKLIEEKELEGSAEAPTIKLENAEVELNVQESLVAINAIAVKRAAIRGSVWSTIGKGVEKPLMLTLCALYSVSSENYSAADRARGDTSEGVVREVDFLLVNGEKKHKCEVKLMGGGNPESADAVFARGSNVFVADKLSEKNIKQLKEAGVEWVHLQEENGFRRFAKVLEKLKIPHKEYSGDLEKDVDGVIDKALELNSSC